MPKNITNTGSKNIECLVGEKVSLFKKTNISHIVKIKKQNIKKLLLFSLFSKKIFIIPKIVTTNKNKNT